MKTHYDIFMEDELYFNHRLLVQGVINNVGFKDMDFVQFKKTEPVFSAIMEDGMDHDIELQTCYALYSFQVHGKKIYEIAPNLAKRFSATNIKAVPSELLKMPFKHILLEIPTGALSIDHHDGTSSVIKSMYVFEMPTGWGTGGDESAYGIYGRCLKFVVFSNNNNAMHFFMTLDAAEVHEALDKSIEYIREYLEKRNEGRRLTDMEINNVRRVFDFALKSLLYITGMNSDVVYYDGSAELFPQLRRVKSPGKRKEIERRIRNAGSARYRVGSKIIIQRREQEMYDGIEKGLWKLSYRFIVQGHFRHQACGERHSERRLIYLEPYWKGPEYAEVVNKPHLVR